MGILDSVLGSVLGTTGASQPGDGLMNAVSGMLGDTTSGGLPGLVESFTKNGLGHVVSSWVGTGQNMPASPEQILKGLGQGRAQDLAQKSGLTLEQLAPLLATMLPMIIDKLTPEGKVPRQDDLAKTLGNLKGLLG
jgi:uncharacterized protein YidB (DUF937 family)